MDNERFQGHVAFLNLRSPDLHIATVDGYRALAPLQKCALPFIMQSARRAFGVVGAGTVHIQWQQCSVRCT